MHLKIIPFRVMLLLIALIFFALFIYRSFSFSFTTAQPILFSFCRIFNAVMFLLLIPEASFLWHDLLIWNENLLLLRSIVDVNALKKKNKIR